MDQGSFTTFNTGNRKKFLDKTRKNKQIHTAIYANNSQVCRIQKNIRRFLHLRKASQFCKDQFKSLLYMKQNDLFQSPALIWKYLIERQSLLLSKKMLIMGIKYLHTQKENGRSRINSGQQMQKMSYSEQMMQNSSQIQPNEDLIRIEDILSQYTLQISSFFQYLSQKQRKFWVLQVYLRTISYEGQILPVFSPQQQQKIREIFLNDPIEYVKLFQNRQINVEAIRQITRIICEQQCPEINFSELCENQKPPICYENAYQNFQKCFWGHSLDELSWKSPKYVVLVMNHFLTTLSQKCMLEIMESYRIEKYLLVSQREMTEQIVKQKLEWLSFLDFLNFSNHSPFISSLMDRFIESQSYEESTIIVNLITSILQISGSNISQIFKINFRHFSITLEKIANWISVHQIQTNYSHQRMLLPYLHIIENKMFNMWDQDFVQFFKGNEEYLEKIIKNNLIKILYKIIFLKKPTPTTDKIFGISVRLLENLYNKIFRTRIISTEAFANQILSSKLKLYKIGNNVDEVGQFIHKFPFIFPLMLRLQKFRQFVYESRYHNWHNQDDEEGFHGEIRIRRGKQFEDAFNALSRKNMRKGFKIMFINEYGMAERGIDAGGLTKEFINRVLKAIFSKELGMFIENAEHQLLPHPERAEVEEGVIAEQYRFVGKMIGKALYEGITIGPKFSGPFLSALIGKKNNFEDLKKIDKDLYNSLLYIRNMEQNAEDLYLTFQFKDQITQRYINLKYNGHKIKVTNENKEEYISLLANYKVNKLLEFQSRHISRGLAQLINKEWLHMFNYQQLNYLISGSGEINVDELRRYTQYQGYTENDKTIKLFWKVVKEFSQQNRSNLLMFVTSCPRPSFLGFKDLSPRFTIIKTQQKESLPVSHTCSNVLQLPCYESEQILRKKLLMAINSDSGFEIA